MRLCQRSEVEVVLGVNAGRDIDVELQEFQKLTFQLIPVIGACLWEFKALRLGGFWGFLEV